MVGDLPTIELTRIDIPIVDWSCKERLDTELAGKTLANWLKEQRGAVFLPTTLLHRDLQRELRKGIG